MRAIDCGDTHTYRELSFFGATVSLILCISTMTTSSLIIAALFRGRNTFFACTFYKVVLNIAMSDLMTGLLGDTGAFNFYIKEGLMIRPSPTDLYWIHIPILLDGGVSILNLSLLSLDRAVALLRPFKYREGVKQWKVIMILSLTWVTSIILIIVYYYVRYIKYLMVYAFTAVIFSTVCLVFTTILYRRKFRTRTSVAVVPSANMMTTPSNTNNSNRNNNQTNEENHNVKREGRQTVSATSQMEKRVNTTFITILLFFLLTYLPACMLTIYMNMCTECNCVFIHVSRDLVLLLIQCSALFRGINFIWRLTTIQRAIRDMFKMKS